MFIIAMHRGERFMVRERKINQKITTEVTLIMQTYFQYRYY